MSNIKSLESMLRGAGFVGKKFDVVWPTALELRRSGLSNESVVRHIFEEFKYLL